MKRVYQLSSVVQFACWFDAVELIACWFSAFAVHGMLKVEKEKKSMVCLQLFTSTR